MDCIDCHNRVGHGIPTHRPVDRRGDHRRQDRPGPALHQAARRASACRSTYASVADADEAIDGLRDFYDAKYPLVAASSSSRRSTRRSPASRRSTGWWRRRRCRSRRRPTRTTSGHQSAPGCFRCHDGAHYKVVDGAVTKETIPAACATCHTFPQIGATESGVLIGQRPNSHDDRLWVFNHKTPGRVGRPDRHDVRRLPHRGPTARTATTRRPSKVPHDDMVYNHASVVAKLGAAGLRLLPPARLLRPVPLQRRPARTPIPNRAWSPRPRRPPHRGPSAGRTARGAHAR